MNKFIRNLITAAMLSGVIAIAASVTAFGQENKSVEPNKAVGNAPTSNIQTVNAQQSGVWNVGIDPVQNTVQVANTKANPVAVKVYGSGSARKAFQARMIVAPLGNGFASAYMQIPAGKRLVIENVSAISRVPAGMRMEMNFFTYIDSNGDGVGDVQDIVFHRIPLIDQGVFGDTQIASASYRTLAFADELIGTGHYGVTVQARLNDVLPANAFAQAQFTFTGYLEDLSEVQ